MFLLIVVFAIGVFVGYKYPQQVDQVIQMAKKTFDDLKNMISKKSQ